MKKQIITLGIGALLLANPGFTQAQESEKSANEQEKPAGEQEKSVSEQAAILGYPQGEAYENGGYSEEAGTPVAGNWSHNLPFKGTKTNEVKWDIETEKPILNSPTVDEDGNIYFLNNNSEVASYDKNGKEKWTFALKDTAEEISASSVVISKDGTLYVSGVNLYALNTDGTVKWKTDISGTQFYQTPAIGKDGTIFVLSSSDKKVYAINPDGSLKWKTDDLKISATDNKSPLIAKDGTIYILDSSKSGKLVVLNPDGTVKWSKSAKGYKNSFSLTKEGKILVPDYSGSKIRIFNPDGTKEKAISLPKKSKVPTAIQSYKTGDIIVPNKYKISAYALDGTLKWHYEAKGTIKSSVVVDNEGVIFFGDNDGIMTALNPDGTVKWELNLKDYFEADSTLFRAAPITFAFDRNGTVIASLQYSSDELTPVYKMVAIGDGSTPSDDNSDMGYLETIEEKITEENITEEEINEAILRLDETLNQLNQLIEKENEQTQDAD